MRDGAGTPSSPVVEVVDLTKTYASGVEAVRGLSFSIEPGECYGLLGPNGAGKSTTLGVLTTRVSPSSGAARVCGFDVVANGSAVRASIGVVPQSNTVDRGLDVLGNLVFHAHYFGLRGDRAMRAARDALAWAGLSNRADAGVLTLSGGMCRRLVLARAVLHDPQVVFLDEPSAGLDVHSRLAVYDMIASLRDRGVTTVVTTHYLEEADRLCDRIAVVDAGRIVALDSPARLRSSVGVAAEVKVSVAEGADRFARCLAERLGPEGGSVRCEESTVVADVRAAQGLFPVVVGAAADAHVEIVDFAVSEPSLESVFVSLTGDGEFLS